MAPRHVHLKVRSDGSDRDDVVNRTRRRRFASPQVKPKHLTSSGELTADSSGERVGIVTNESRPLARVI